MKFQALIDFKSREFGGTQYIKDGVYTIRAASEYKLEKAGRPTLTQMVAKWSKAQLFAPTEDLDLFGVCFKTGVISYCIDEQFAVVVQQWVDEGKAEYVDGSLVTLSLTTQPSGVTGV